MSKVEFDGCEPITDVNKKRLPVYDLPSTKEIIASNFKRQKSDAEKKETYRIMDASPTPPVFEEEKSAHEEFEEFKEELKAVEELKALADPI